HSRIVRRRRDRRGPLETVTRVLGAVSGVVVRIGADVAYLAGAFLEVGNVTGVFAGIDLSGGCAVENEIAGLAATGIIKIAQVRAGAIAGTQHVGRPAGGAPVLDRAADVIGDPVVDVDVVELRRRQRRRRPGRAAVGADVESAVDRKSTRLNSSHSQISYAVFCLK